MEQIATRSMKDAAAVKLLTIIMMVYLPATIVLVRESNPTPLGSTNYLGPISYLSLPLCHLKLVSGKDQT